MTKLRSWRVAISAFVAISIGLNVVLIVGLMYTREGLRSALAMANDTLIQSAGEPLVIEVAVDQAIPIQTMIPIEQSFVVPLEFNYPLNTVINTYVDIPVLGRQDIAVPVETVIPISTTLAIPVEMDVPISVTYQLQTRIPVEVQIPSTMLTALEGYFEQLDAGLSFRLK
jgi:hypothetical protein